MNSNTSGKKNAEKLDTVKSRTHLKNGKKRKHLKGAQQRTAKGFVKYTITIEAEQLKKLKKKIGTGSTKEAFSEAITDYVNKKN